MMSLIPDSYYSTKEPTALKCQTCKTDDLQFSAGGNTPSSCDYLSCPNCKTRVCGYGKERLITAWNNQQRIKIKI